MPFLAGLDTDFLEALEAAGVSPASVDIVVNTHVHTDHVGWNTRRENDRWVPTFPNARYLVPEADYRYYHPENADARGPAGTRSIRRDSMRAESCSPTVFFLLTRRVRSNCGPMTTRSASR